MKKNYAITGATGALGSILCQRLIERGDGVTALVRNVNRGRELLPSGVSVVRWESHDSSGEWSAAIDGIDGVVNLAGATLAQRWTARAKKEMVESRVVGTRNIVDAIERASRRPEVLVNAAAVGYYGDDPTTMYTEASPAGTGFLAETAAAWEHEAFRAKALGVRVVAVRGGVVLATSHGALARLLLPFKLGLGGPVASGRQPFSWIHVDDAINLFLWALDNHRVEGPVNGVAPEAITNAEFSRALGRALHRPTIVRIPAFVIRLVLGDGVVMLTEGQRVTPERTLALGFRFQHPTIDGALGNLIGGR